MARTPFRDRPIKQKLRIVTLIIIAIMGIIAISGDAAKEYFSLHRDTQKKMATLSAIIAQASLAGITFNNAKEAEKELALLITVPNITSAAIYLADGTEFAVYKRKATDEKELGGYFYKDLHSLSQPILLEGRALGRIEVKWELQEEYKKLLWYVLIVVALTFIFAPLISLFLIERLMQTIIMPIAVLSSSAAEIGKGNLYHRVEVTSKDEIGQLAASFNRMALDLRTTTVSMELLIKEVEERQRVEEVLKNKEVEWQNTFDSISDFVSVHTLDFKFVRINKALAAFLGVMPEETIGRPCYELYHNLTGPLKDCPVHAMLESRQSETREVYDSGRGLSLLITTSPVFDRDGKIIASVHIAKDITERKKAEQELKRSNTELEQFSYAISHDMRQPLRMISSYLQLLETGLAGQLDSEKREYFNFAIDGAKRLDHMLLSLLEYSRVGRKGEPLVWVESREALDEALLFLSPLITEASADIRIHGDWPRIFVSRDEMVRLLQNLISNALKFRIAGRRPELNIYSEAVEHEWHLSVSDNGIGITPEQIGRLFQVFQRLQLRTAYEGTGVGLALCRKIVEHHRGLIWAESTGEGKGSAFKISLPLDYTGGGVTLKK